MLPAILLAGCVGMVAAATQSGEWSENAVGFVQRVCEAGQVYLFRNDFLSTEGEVVTASTLLGNQVPPGTVVHIWDQWDETGGYLSATNLAGAGWVGDGADIELLPGTGFWLDLSSPSIAGGPWDVWFFGDVPGTANQRETTAYGRLDVDVVGFPYPAEVDLFEATAIGRHAPAHAVIHRWSAEGTGAYQSAGKRPDGVWDGPATELGPLRQAEAFWLDLSAPEVSEPALDAVESKPYAWP